MQKFLFDINRDGGLQQEFRANMPAVLDRYTLDGAERRALETGDVGLIFVLGANGQLPLHYAAYLRLPWADFIAAMRDGVRRHGPVRAGVYAMTTRLDEKVAGL